MKKILLITSIILIIGGVLILQISKTVLHYGNQSFLLGKHYEISGFLLSPCMWIDGRFKAKAGPAFQLCEWDYENKNFRKMGRRPDCIWLDIWPYQENQQQQILEYKKYLKRTVRISGVVKAIKYGSKEQNCRMAQIGCERDLIILKPDNIQEFDLK